MSSEHTFEAFTVELARLVEIFHKNFPHYKAEGYDESSLRNDFLNPFWRALGWDIENREGLPQPLREVQVETRVHIGGKKKRADYIFRTDGINRFVCEAKKPQDDLGQKSAYQAQRYAFNLQLLVATLSNFERLELFIVGGRPDKDAPWDVCRKWHYSEYLGRSRELWDLLSRDNVATGTLDKFIAALPKRAIAGRPRQGWLIAPERIRTVDSEFLAYIENQRERLAKDLVANNKSQNWEHGALLNESVQRILDRVLFVRICEDRDIDTGRPLEKILADWESIPVGKPSLYSQLVTHFNSLDDSFNGALFRRGHESETLHVSDAYLADLIRDLSSEDSPYLFSTLPVEILGQVYERFIGKVIHVSKRGKLSADFKPEVRKAGGVYYTPRYVVDFIVRHTLVAMLEGKTPKDVAKLKVVDPACGSGSFLIQVFERLCEYYLRWLQSHPEQRRESWCYLDDQRNLHLTTHLKRQIVLNNIFGVDIDYQAVEVTMLSLYLKILEGETRSTLGQQQRLFPKETFLPDLGDNIKCGNSLIGTDYVGHSQLAFIPEDEPPVNPFDWETEFTWLSSRKRFDVVLGNPPWGADFDEDQRHYLAAKFSRVVARMVDSYIYFTYQGLLLLHEGGVLGFIVPSTILNQVDARPLRSVILDRRISQLVSLGQGVFGPKPLNTSTIIATSPQQPKDGFQLRDLSGIQLEERKAQLSESTTKSSWQEWEGLVRNDPHLTFFMSNWNAVAILNRLRQRFPPLSDSLIGSIQRGVSPDVVAAHVLTRRDPAVRQIEKNLLKASVSGTQIKHYKPFKSDQYIVYTNRNTMIDKYPQAKKHLNKFRKLNKCKEVKAKKHPWWSLHRPRDPNIFDSPKFIGLTTVKTIELVYDESESLFATDAMYVFSLRAEYDPFAALAVLQSSLFLFLYRISNLGESRVIPQVKAAKLEPLPVPELIPSEKLVKSLREQSQIMLSLNKKIRRTRNTRDKRALERRLVAAETQIDRLVYKLYGLSESDIRVVGDTLSGKDCLDPSIAKSEGADEMDRPDEAEKEVRISV